MEPEVAGAAPVFHPNFMPKTYSKNVKLYSAFIAPLKLILVLLFFAVFLYGAFSLDRDISRQVEKHSNVENNKKINKKPLADILYPASYVRLLTPSPSKEPEVAVGFCLRVPVILYHHIEPYEQAKSEGHAQLTVDSGWFEKQMKYLSEHGYTTISAEDLVNALLSHQQIPGKPVVVTIDDGYLDNYQFAFQTAKKFNTKLNLMIPTGLIGVPGYMSWGQVKEMAGSGIAYIYNHTWSHYSLGQTTLEKAKQEIGTADKQLQDQLGKKVDIFTYPYGSTSPIATEVLKQSGYKAAFTTVPSTLQCDGYIYYLKRLHIGNAPLSYYGF